MELTVEQKSHKFDLYGALYLLCSKWHSGQNSRGYRILSRIAKKGYRPGLSISHNTFESEEQKELYYQFLRLRKTL